MITELYSVKAIPGEYKRLYGRDVDIYDVIELLPIVLRNTHGVPPDYLFIKTKCSEAQIILPCVYYSVQYVITPDPGCEKSIEHIINCGQGILVNYDLQAWQDSMAAANGDVVANQVVVPAVKVNESFPRKPTGRFVDFQARGNVLTLPATNLDIEILLTVMPVDDEGYPKVTEQVITAVAAFMNMVYVQKKYYSGQMPQYVFNDAKKDYNDYVGDALSPQHISDNELNDIMNALSSYNRHSYNNPLRYG